MIISTNLIPHGTQIIPGLEQTYNEKFRSLHEEMSKSIDGDVLLLLTPHGAVDDDDFLIYNHDNFQGLYYEVNTAESILFGSLKYSKFWNGNTEMVDALIKHLDGMRVRRLTQGVPEYPMTLAWGETVPLYYHGAKKQIIILSIPRRRYKEVTQMKTELKELGKRLLEFCNIRSERISIAISGDLAHTHKEDGPYGFSSTSESFDKLVNKWINNPTGDILDDMLQLNDTALSCGMAGICVLQGIFEYCKHQLMNSHYVCPSYFGMLIANWHPY